MAFFGKKDKKEKKGFFSRWRQTDEQKEIEERVHASLANTDFDDDIDHEPWD